MAPLRNPAFSFFKMGLATGALLSLPLALAAIWYAWSAFAQIHRLQGAAPDKAPWSAELFQIALHDELVRDLRRVVLAEPPTNSALPIFSLSLSRDNFDALNQQLYSDEARTYVKGYAQKDGQIHPLNLRYRGSKGWHWLNAQKSMKLKLERGDLIDGTRVFNLINDPTPFGLEDQIILDLARQLDLLAPEYHPVRVRLNNSDMGVYRYAAQPVEGLLRRGRRIPGPIYSGDTDKVDPKRGVGALFFSRAGWQQVAQRSAAAAEEFAPLDQFLSAVNKASFTQFAAYAATGIDLERYARFDALDVAFGGTEHDYFSNHKFYFDPYRGKLEPVAWSFRGFSHEPVFNLVDHPLLIRLKMIPTYLARRDRALYTLLVGKGSVAQVRAHANILAEKMAPDLATDPYWDAYKLLPRVSRFHRFMARPMSSAKWLLATQAELEGYSRRVRYLLDRLEKNHLLASTALVSTKQTRLDLQISGHTALQLRQISVSGPCADPFTLRPDANRNNTKDSADPIIAAGIVGNDAPIKAYADLLPGIRLVPNPAAQAKRGQVRTQRERRTYTYWLSSDCLPSQVALQLDNLVTGSTARIIVPPAKAPLPRQNLPPANSTPALEAGQGMPHPWDFVPRPIPQTVHLGPDIVRVESTRVYSDHQQVHIAPGTRIEMAPNTSLVFRGPVHAIGTLGRPIEIVAAQKDQPFGGIAIQGPATAGSVFKHVHLSGGTKIGSLGIDYPSLFSIYDSKNINLSAIYIADIQAAEDVLHAAYVDNIRLSEITIVAAPIDGIDLEFSQGEIRGLRLEGAGDDCLDLMGVDLRLYDSILKDCTNNALSAGEESEVNANALMISQSSTGILAKNASHVRIARSLFYRSGTALKTKRRQLHYAGPSSIGANELFAVQCLQVLDQAKATRIESGPIQRALPTKGVLNHLAHNVLGLSEWSAFSPQKKGQR